MRKNNYRSKFEADVGTDLATKGSFGYEPIRLPYTSVSHYVPDFVLENGIIIEAKGRFTSADRSKHLKIKKHYPDLDIRFVFQNANNMLYKGSNTTYARWCRKHGYKFSTKYVPKEWVDEPDKPDYYSELMESIRYGG